VFPKGRLHPEAPKFRLNHEGLTFQKILDGFAVVMDDLEDSKSFINANIDLVPSKLFLRALTAQKLSAQSKNDLERMDYLKEVRRRYILAGDQVFFPLNIEVQKAETRVMTYLARDELRSWAETWDEVIHSSIISKILYFIDSLCINTLTSKFDFHTIFTLRSIIVFMHFSRIIPVKFNLILALPDIAFPLPCILFLLYFFFLSIVLFPCRTVSST
jgi:hypothetical protein